jgi:hypothetical protein
MMGWPGAQAALPLTGAAPAAPPPPEDWQLPPGLLAAVEADLADRARRFLAATADLDGTALARCIAHATRQGWGTWTAPVTADPALHPATHLHEIDLFGIAATGATATEAALHWRSVATRQTSPDEG